jgi:hypothetical protein
MVDMMMTSSLGEVDRRDPSSGVVVEVNLFQGKSWFIDLPFNH